MDNHYCGSRTTRQEMKPYCLAFVCVRSEKQPGRCFSSLTLKSRWSPPLLIFLGRSTTAAQREEQVLSSVLVRGQIMRTVAVIWPLFSRWTEPVIAIEVIAKVIDVSPTACRGMLRQLCRGRNCCVQGVVWGFSRRNYSRKPIIGLCVQTAFLPSISRLSG